MPLPPIWARWVLAVVIAVAVLVGIVIVVGRAGPESPTTEGGAEAEINRVADIAIAEDQAPHLASLSAGSAPAFALERAIESDVRQRIAKDRLTGPLQSVICTAAGASSAAGADSASRAGGATGPESAGREPYRCTVRSANIAYPFLAVVDKGRQRLTWCKVDPPPVAEGSPEIPISASCRA
jgi:hypothetical protein